MFRLLILLIALIGVVANVSKSTTVDGAIVAAQFRCLGYLCPKWALDVSRYDVVRLPGVQFEYQLIELLPLGPTAQRSSNLWTAYNEVNREYTVAVQDYPSAGMDTFFVVSISNDVTSAKAVHNNVIIGHPDAAPGNPGKMSLARVMYDSNGNYLTIFRDGSVFSLDIANQAYKMIANIYSASNVASSAVSNAHMVVNGVLKSVLYDSANYLSYVIKTDLATGTVSKAVQVQPMKGFNLESPVAAHQTVDPNTGDSKFTVVFTGNFNQITWIDEDTGIQTPVFSDMTNQVEGNPVQFMCNEYTKDCDTKWLTTAYDAKNNKMYLQIHAIDGDMTETYIYYYQYVTSKLDSSFYPILDPAVTMTFGYSGYQWVPFV